MNVNHAVDYAPLSDDPARMMAVNGPAAGHMQDPTIPVADAATSDEMASLSQASEWMSREAAIAPNRVPVDQGAINPNRVDVDHDAVNPHQVSINQEAVNPHIVAIDQDAIDPNAVSDPSRQLRAAADAQRAAAASADYSLNMDANGVTEHPLSTYVPELSTYHPFTSTETSFLSPYADPITASLMPIYGSNDNG